VLLLLAEDEPLIQLASEDALKAGGYSVITASTGAEAMALLDSRYQELSGLITDIKMGTGQDGWTVARHARELKPEMPVVYATADSAHEWPAQGVPKSVVVQKPYASAQLVTAISALLTEADTNNTG
jgi:CheY-like chemotaxis protein